MAASDILIECYNPSNLNDVVTFTREMRTRFRFSHGMPGGNLSASWTVDCARLGDTGFPKPKARIRVSDPVRGTYLWRGVLQTPTLHYERGKLSSVDFSAVGCADGSSWRQFPSTTVFGAAAIPSLTGTAFTQFVTDLSEIMTFGLTITPLIDGTSSVASAGVLTETTRDYVGLTAPQLWEDVCNLTRGSATPFTWLVEPDAAGLAALFFFAESPSPVYFEHGNAKESSLEIDWSQVANTIYVIFNGRILQAPLVGDPVDYTYTPDLQTSTVNVSDIIRDFDIARGFTDQLYTHSNQLTVTGGQIVLDKDIRTTGPAFIPCYEIRAGRGIQLEFTKTPYLPGVALDIIIKRAEYDEDACTMTVSPAVISEEGKQARILATRAEQAQATMSWAWIDTNLRKPIPTFYGITPAAAGQVAGSISNGRIIGDTPLPVVSRHENNGVTGYTDGEPNGWDPNSVPQPYTALPAGAREFLIEHGAPVFAKARELLYGLGVTGRKIHPQEIPDQRLNIPAQFSTFDPITGDLTDGERMHTDVQEGWFDTITVSVLGGTATTVTVKVDVYNWDDDAIRLSDAFQADLTGLSSRIRLQYDNSDNSHRPVLLYHGDQLIWKVEGATDEVILNCAISGDRAWTEFPVLVGPESIPGNA